MAYAYSGPMWHDSDYKRKAVRKINTFTNAGFPCRAEKIISDTDSPELFISIEHENKARLP